MSLDEVIKKYFTQDSIAYRFITTMRGKAYIDLYNFIKSLSDCDLEKLLENDSNEGKEFIFAYYLSLFGNIKDERVYIKRSNLIIVLLSSAILRETLIRKGLIIEGENNKVQTESEGIRIQRINSKISDSATEDQVMLINLLSQLFNLINQILVIEFEESKNV